VDHAQPGDAVVGSPREKSKIPANFRAI
jgi:hypothetical protein